MFIILLRLLLHERRSWTRERAELVAEHRANVAELEARYRATRRDYEHHIESLRARIESLEAEVTLLREWRRAFGDDR